MEANKIHVEVSWTGDNFCGSWDDGHDGCISYGQIFPEAQR